MNYKLKIQSASHKNNISVQFSLNGFNIAPCADIPIKFLTNAIGYSDLTLISSDSIKITIPEYTALSLLSISDVKDQTDSPDIENSALQRWNNTSVQSRIHSGALAASEIKNNPFKDHFKRHYIPNRHSIIEEGKGTGIPQIKNNHLSECAWNISFIKKSPEIPIRVNLSYQGKSAIQARTWDIWDILEYLKITPRISELEEFNFKLPLSEPEALFIAAYLGYCKNLKNEEEECDLTKTSINEVIFAGLKARPATDVYHDGLAMLELSPYNTYFFEQRYNRSELSEFIHERCEIG